MVRSFPLKGCSANELVAVYPVTWLENCGLLLFGFGFGFVFVLLETKVRQTTPLFTQHLL